MRGYEEQRPWGWGISPVETIVECNLQNLQGSNTNPGRLFKFVPPASSTSPAHDPPAQRRQHQFAASHSWHQTPHSKSKHRWNRYQRRTQSSECDSCTFCLGEHVSQKMKEKDSLYGPQSTKVCGALVQPVARPHALCTGKRPRSSAYQKFIIYQMNTRFSCRSNCKGWQRKLRFGNREPRWIAVVFTAPSKS